MKYIKFLFINVIVFGGLLFGISLLFPSTTSLSKSINIIGSKEQCLSKISDTSIFTKWNLLYLQQANSLAASTSKTDTTIIVSSYNDKTLITDVYEIYSTDSLQSIITWKKFERLPWYKPFKKYSAMVTNKQIAVAMDSSLTQLKSLIEVH